MLTYLSISLDFVIMFLEKLILSYTSAYQTFCLKQEIKLKLLKNLTVLNSKSIMAIETNSYLDATPFF